mmetsp:Transcript_32686/g.58624  ORF Transcript_32686/g.58624 Transcript_32686/m.58624 type:complete len:209 (+) Transcript_32686:582-1208(+)
MAVVTAVSTYPQCRAAPHAWGKSSTPAPTGPSTHAAPWHPRGRSSLLQRAGRGRPGLPGRCSKGPSRWAQRGRCGPTAPRPAPHTECGCSGTCPEACSAASKHPLPGGRTLSASGNISHPSEGPLWEGPPPTVQGWAYGAGMGVDPDPFYPRGWVGTPVPCGWPVADRHTPAAAGRRPAVGDQPPSTAVPRPFPNGPRTGPRIMPHRL